jgi:hypothetical protein
MKEQLCGTCGAPATRMAGDVEDVTPPGSAWRYFKHHGAARFGCDAHPPSPPMERTSSGRVVGRLTDDEGRPIPR